MRAMILMRLIPYSDYLKGKKIFSETIGSFELKLIEMIYGQSNNNQGDVHITLKKK